MILPKSLVWVLSNRRPRRRVSAFAVLAREVLSSASRGRRREAGDPRIEAYLFKCVDEEFRAHCAIGPIRNGTLSVVVDDERLLYAYRSRWTDVLLARLAKLPGRRAVSRIRFEANTEH